MNCLKIKGLEKENNIHRGFEIEIKVYYVFELIDLKRVTVC